MSVRLLWWERSCREVSGPNEVMCSGVHSLVSINESCSIQSFSLNYSYALIFRHRRFTGLMCQNKIPLPLELFHLTLVFNMKMPSVYNAHHLDAPGRRYDFWNHVFNVVTLDTFSGDPFRVAKAS